MPVSEQHFDDFALMQAIALRDRSALSKLYDRHAPLLLGVCRRVLRDAGEAEDVLTDVFFEIWSRADRFDSTRGSPLTYLVTLARSRSIDRKRSLATRSFVKPGNTDVGQASGAPEPLQTLKANEQSGIVRQALSQLDPAQRELIECSFFDGLSHSEIAEKYSKPLGTVKTYIRQGLIRLRESLRNQYG